MSKVVPFPPLPPVQAPPAASPDPRQETFYSVVGTITAEMIRQSPDATVHTGNGVTGYRASAVDVGHIQELLEAGIRHFDMDDVRARWNVDLFQWFLSALSGWIQRRKYLHFDLEDNGIRVTIQTQDDRGYHHYEFDVFPGKNLRLSRPPTHL